jgi:hypothetical protein
MIMERDKNAEWTDYQKLYERFLYKGPGWGRERAGLPPAAPGTPWQGQSLYRREALGQLDGAATDESEGASRGHT